MVQEVITVLSVADQLENGLIEFAVRIIKLAAALPKSPAGRHISAQISDAERHQPLTMVKLVAQRVAQILSTRQE